MQLLNVKAPLGRPASASGAGYRVLSLERRARHASMRPPLISSTRALVLPCAVAPLAPPHRSPPLGPAALNALQKMSRPQNLVPSMALVLLGAWAGAGHTLGPVLGSCGPVLATTAASAAVAAASMIMNDYFDFMSGTDVINCPDKPLPSGQVSPDAAVLASSILYMAVLVATCLMEASLLRATLALSAAATFLYTPLLKRVPLIKNATVALVVALAPMSGALAVSQDAASLYRVLPCSAFAFGALLYREVVMDVADIAGDAATGVWTLPVLLGRLPALAVGCACLLAGSAAALLLLMHRSYLAVVSGLLAAAFQGLSGCAPAPAAPWWAATGGGPAGMVAGAGPGALVWLQGLDEAGLVLRALSGLVVVACSSEILRQALDVARGSIEVASAIQACAAPTAAGLLSLALLA